ncbi:glycosyltransferase family 2 protein [Methylocaldum marinum]|uniref:glycosyltransferase family 2 protein n=1 Tax=Methylocaldum marinum TaxID=1432792 RepID=UPI000E69C836|nr:glycosyltransferase family 2 protein [Methylocaldum marinum]
MPKVAVIIVSWDSAPFLSKCLASLREQTFQEFRTIVIHNGEFNDTLVSAQSTLESAEIICLGKNRGFAAGNNVAAQLLKGKDCDWIALLNPDAFPEPNWLDNLLKATIAYPEYSFFGSRLVVAHDPTLLDGVGDAYHTSGLVWRRGHGSTAINSYEEPEEIFSPCAAAALYRKDAFLEVGGFDEDFFCYVEDVDLGFRMRLAGHRCLYVPDAVVAHVGSASTGRHSDFSIYHGHRNIVWTYIKNMPFPLFWIYLPQHLFLNIISVIWFVFFGQTRVILNAKIDAVKGIPVMLEKRRTIQRSRKIKAFDVRKIMNKGVAGRHQLLGIQNKVKRLINKVVISRLKSKII